MTHQSPFANTVFLITHNGIGHADTALQQKLLHTWLRLILEARMFPAAICFYTEGVYLVTEGSPVLELLHQLEKEGVRLIICSTCLDYFGLREKVRVGTIGGMPDILEAQARAEKVITL